MVLQQVVEACASNVAVLDETGTILFVSKTWDLTDPRYRTVGSQYPWPITWLKRNDGATTSALGQDIGEILWGMPSEFHREYHCEDNGPKRSFDVHAARLDLSEPDRFRVLINIEELTKAREAEERLRSGRPSNFSPGR